jgi:hypothetical protein
LVENENDDSIINIELRLFIYNIDLFYAWCIPFIYN